MTRLQILHLPAPPDEYPFALVIDAAGDDAPAIDGESIAELIGARAVLVFADEVDLP